MNLKEKVLIGVLVIFLNLVAWQKDGVQVCTASGDQWDPKIATLDGGKTAICWQDGRIDTVKLYFQVLDPLGNSLFTKNGVKILTNQDTKYLTLTWQSVYIICMKHIDFRALLPHETHFRNETVLSISCSP